jgi:Flp pilus assembly protein TadG
MGATILKSICKFFLAPRGATAVEFAVVFPLFAAALFFTLTFSEIAHVRSHLNKVVGEAARYARLASGPSPSQIQTYIVNRMSLVTSVVPVVDFSPAQIVGDGVKRTITASITMNISIPLYPVSGKTVTATADLFTRN